MLYDKLLHNDLVPMHMPGHKRNTALSPYLSALRADLDVTEITGFDNLHDAHGVLADIMVQASGLWGSLRSFLLVGGSTCGIIAGIRTLTHRGDKVIVSRNAHKSVFHAIELCGLEPVFILPPVIDDADIFGSLSPDPVAEVLAGNPDARLVIITSPTYEGVISDVGSIVRVAHDAGVPVLVDEAHGAHLSLCPEFCGSGGSAVQAGADIVVQSLHKTLPSLTQTAMLHVCSDSVDTERLAHQLAVFETSSPSYLLMASVGGCVKLLTERPQIISDWVELLDSFDKKISPLEKLRVFGHGADIPCFAFDRSKIPIYTGCTGLSGYELADILREEYGIELEYSAPRLALAMTGPGDTSETLSALADALVEIDSRCALREPPTFMPVTALLRSTRLVMPPEQALEADCAPVTPDSAENRVCGEYVWAYPPGVPLLIPGEIITAEIIEALSSTGMPELHSTSGKIPAYIKVTS